MRSVALSATIAGMSNLRRAAPGTPEGLLREAPGGAEPAPARETRQAYDQEIAELLRAALAKLDRAR